MTDPKNDVPQGLSDDARDLFLDVLEEHSPLDSRRFHALVQAARLVTLADNAEAAVGEDYTVPGYRGQPVANGLLTEIRLARAAAVAALKVAGLAVPSTAPSAAASALARKRWAAA